MASSSRRKQDEKHLKILRELVSQPANKTCFDCNQKGPTYINMLVGSFVCTTCSGILRGLNPPHRVKSISMASFTPEEIEQIKQKGNHYCRAVWLGLYDLKANPFPDTKDEHKIRDFMIAKYEKRRFYVDPSIALKSMPPQTTVSTPTSSTPTTDNKPAASVARPIVTSSQSTGSVNGGSSHGSSKTATPKSSSLDLLADMSRNNDPFASPTLPAPPASQPSFANFENATIFTNTPSSTTATKPSGLPPFPSATLTPLTPSTSGSGPATVPQAAPHSTTTTTTLEAAAASSTTTTQQEDRYAALKDLDDLLKSQKEETNGSGKGNWSIANGSTQGSAFNGTTNGVFGSPSNSSSVFGSHMVNGGNSPMGVFGTPPSNGGTNFLPQTSQAWSSNFTANPFTAAQSGVNGTGNGGSGSTSPWMNGGANTTVTNSNSLFSPATQTQPGFGNISAQPNPFGADPNFNQFGSNGQVTNSSSNGTGWANFNTQPTQTKMQWASNASVNPFAAPSQMPSGSTSYNPFL
ncbi:arf GTPase activating protein drongo isoform X2 [Oratosquilla oratoria]|uniref:arf GTPase activating protein drongo isoform X2 n=1 Tax=Oratosquilla oratoria TaxID=337810 RepID=UPI003F7747E5